MADQASRIRAHEFDTWSYDLMNRPAQVPAWRWASVESQEYRKQYEAYPVNECGEEMVDCSSLGLVSTDFYLEKLISGAKEFSLALDNGLLHASALLRRSIAKDLAKIDGMLRSHGLFIYVLSGWRHPNVQELAIEWASKQYGAASTEIRYAKPTATPHATGAACDLELWSLQTGQSLTKVDRGDDISFCRVESQSDSTPDDHLKKGVRRLLFHVLCSAEVCLTEDKCFTIHPGETWHFGRDDSMSAYFERRPYARYGRVNPS